MQEPEPTRARPEAGSPVRPLRGGDDRPVWASLALVAVAIGVALLKPWAAVPGAPAAGAGDWATDRGARATRSPGPAATPSPADPNAELFTTCGNPSGWRVATLQAWPGRAAPIRTWLAVDPVPVTGTGDPRIPLGAGDRRIPFVPLATDLVLAMGYCSPVGVDQPPQAVSVEIWSVTDDGAPVLLHAPRLEPGRANALGGLWLPPRDRRVVLDGAWGWAPGRYAVRLWALSYERWLGVEIRNLALTQAPSPSPVAEP